MFCMFPGPKERAIPHMEIMHTETAVKAAMWFPGGQSLA